MAFCHLFQAQFGYFRRPAPATTVRKKDLATKAAHNARYSNQRSFAGRWAERFRAKAHFTRGRRSGRDWKRERRKIAAKGRTNYWFVLGDAQLSSTARSLIEDAATTKLISPAVYWEVAIKISIGKYKLNEPFESFLDRALFRSVF